MGRISRVYLLLGAVSEALLLLTVSGSAGELLNVLKYLRPEWQLSAVASFAPSLPKFGLMVPFALVLLACIQRWPRIASDRLTVHALAISIIICSIISVATMLVVFLATAGDAVAILR